MNPFETETMADLCLRQGHLDEALAIYRRLLGRAGDEAARARIARRIDTIERAPTVQPQAPRPPAAARGGGRPRGAAPPPLPVPGARVRCAGDELTIEWRLPAGTAAPALQILIVTRPPASGVVTETRAQRVDGVAGRLVLEIPHLHSARVAAGSQTGGRFIPLARA